MNKKTKMEPEDVLQIMNYFVTRINGLRNIKKMDYYFVSK